ncbi:copper transporter [Georgenia yuyongxinii]|uniref:Copper transporter n=1 Tax=Georgenia yuyongxinii TaxID=2589797 RepID=A0A552WK39_9MICO|nr:copper transporter [Georgenia yuyongxinii]TRW43107.1 copper transporter [Georgenia yuyongxinii]
MIDFRYHLVSLIAVFLALAVGIVLGAGPLRDTIGDTLTGQVQDLRADRERLRGDLEASEADVTERTTYLEQSAGVLLEGALTDQSVTVVTVPGTAADDVEAVRDRLAQAGAEVLGEVAVTEAWTDPANLTFRQTFAGQLLGYIDPAPGGDAGVETIFGLALAHALTDTGEDGAPTEDAATLLDLLSSAEAPLVSLTTAPTGQADAIVLVGPPAAAPPAPDADPEETDAAAAVLGSQVRLAEALSGVAPAVTVGAAASDLDLVAAVRADDAAAAAVTTVDSVGEITAALSTPLATAVALSGGHGHFGFLGGADVAVPPRVELAPPVVEPADETPTDAEAGNQGETAGTEAAPVQDAA